MPTNGPDRAPSTRTSRPKRHATPTSGRPHGDRPSERPDAARTAVPAPQFDTARAAHDELRRAATTYSRVFFRSQLGNGGDALINAGFYHLAASLGLDYVEVCGDRRQLPELGPDDLLIMTGGGSLSDHWEIGAPALAELATQDFSLLILPSSLRGNAETLRLLRERDTLMVRDPYSHAYAASLGLSCRLVAGEDLAFGVDVREVLTTSPWRRPTSKDEVRRLAALARHRVRGARGATLRAWRTDGEASYDASGNLRRDDVSQLADFGTLTRAASLYSAQWMLRVASWYQRVETDRLHMAIACVLMGTPVTLFDNDYQKIRGVYEQSIAPRPDRSRFAQFCEDSPDIAAPGRGTKP